VSEVLPPAEYVGDVGVDAMNSSVLQWQVGLLDTRISGHLEHASLREDYLNQVQRDFLSRCLS
jgi:hypothetical protein